MKDPTKQLHDAYFTLLNGNVSVNGTEIPVFKWAQSGSSTRVTVGEAVLDDESSKDTYITEVMQTIYIQADLRIKDERDVAENISDAVCQLVVVTSTSLMTLTDFDMVTAELAAVDTFEPSEQDSTLFIKELVFKHLITEN